MPDIQQQTSNSSAPIHIRGAGTTLKLGGGGKLLPVSKVTPTQN